MINCFFTTALIVAITVIPSLSAKMIGGAQRAEPPRGARRRPVWLIHYPPGHAQEQDMSGPP